MESCAICLEIKDDPVGIPCGHSFCQKCLENYERIAKGTKCPLCRHPFVNNKDEEPGQEHNERFFEVFEDDDSLSDISVMDEDEFVLDGLSISSSEIEEEVNEFVVNFTTEEDTISVQTEYGFGDDFYNTDVELSGGENCDVDDMF